MILFHFLEEIKYKKCKKLYKLMNIQLWIWKKVINKNLKKLNKMNKMKLKQILLNLI